VINKIAYASFTSLHLEFDVRQVGLSSAAHLKGGEGGTVKIPETTSDGRSGPSRRRHICQFRQVILTYEGFSSDQV